MRQSIARHVVVLVEHNVCLWRSLLARRIGECSQSSRLACTDVATGSQHAGFQPRKPVSRFERLRSVVTYACSPSMISRASDKWLGRCVDLSEDNPHPTLIRLRRYTAQRAKRVLEVPRAEYEATTNNRNTWPHASFCKIDRCLNV